MRLRGLRRFVPASSTMPPPFAPGPAPESSEIRVYREDRMGIARVNAIDRGWLPQRFLPDPPLVVAGAAPEHRTRRHRSVASFRVKGVMMRGQQRVRRRGIALALAIVAIAPVAVLAQPAVAAKKHATIPFAYKITATTHIKKLNQTVTPPTGTFKGQIDLTAQRLTGNINLPPATFTTKLAGAVPLTATAKIVQSKPVTGTINLSNFKVKATSTFNFLIVSAYAAGVPVNLVGNSCTTATPVSVTMSGT